jgi:hypothetical protein
MGAGPVRSGPHPSQDKAGRRGRIDNYGDDGDGEREDRSMNKKEGAAKTCDTNVQESSASRWRGQDEQ